jgi:hypothetical protein
MANANAVVEKLAGVGLRHGEKAGVAIAMMVFLVCVGMAFSRPTINTTPEKVKKAAEQSRNNLDRKEERDFIVKRLEENEKIVPTHFADAVEEQIKVKLDPVAYTPKRDWVTPEPGAGLIRDTPKLIAPTELFAYPGRGGILMYALDDEGNRIPLKEGEEEDKKPQRYGNTRRPRGGAGGMGGGMGMMGGGMRKKRGKSKQEIEREEKEQRAREERELKSGLVGTGGRETPKEETDKEKEEGGPFKQVTKGYRWVAITGTLDHAQMLANYRQALKNPAIAHPNYLRLDLERRVLQPDGTWSDWQKVDADKNLSVLDNLPANEEELAPKEVLPEGLVDPLPFLNAGLWEKVHIASLVPKEKTQLPEEPKAQPGMGMAGGMGNRAAMMNMGAAMTQQRMMQAQNQMGNMGNRMAMMGGGASGGMRGGMGMGMGMGGYGSTESVGNFWKSEEKRVMIRALDFMVEPETSYRYRVRIVVVNPNYNRDDVSAESKADTKKKVLEGPWSKETDIVSMPPDVEPYAMGTLPPNPRSDTKARFQVIRFNPADGWTIPRSYDAGVGEVIGEFQPSQEVPNSEGKGKQREPIDFNSHHIVLDVAGGGYQNLPSGLVGPSIERPAWAALLRPDGAMVVHNQADDVVDEVRKDIEGNFKHELDASGKKRESSQGSGYMGMMQQMMGGMGGYPGMGGMGGGRR